MAKILMRGSEAIAEASIQAGCKLYFGYPITPQTELAEYLAKKLPEIDGCFLQAESEIAAINMVYGAVGTGNRAFTSSSSPGVALMQEGISYAAAGELPLVFVNIMRAGPGLGSIVPGQSDYFQSTRGGGNGGYRTLTLSPSTVQEACDLMQLAFELAEKYRNPVLLLGDAMVSQMMEPVEIKKVEPKPYNIDWATRGWTPNLGRPRVNINQLRAPGLERRIQEKYAQMAKEDMLVEEYNLEGAKYVIAAYGIVARIAKNAIDTLEEKGIKVGLIRPITLFPFPYESFNKCAERESVKAFATIEMSEGQMIDDVKLGINGKKPVEFRGWLDRAMPTPSHIVDFILQLEGGK